MPAPPRLLWHPAAWPAASRPGHLVIWTLSRSLTVGIRVCNHRLGLSEPPRRRQWGAALPRMPTLGVAGQGTARAPRRAAVVGLPPAGGGGCEEPSGARLPARHRLTTHPAKPVGETGEVRAGGAVMRPPTSPPPHPQRYQYQSLARRPNGWRGGVPMNGRPLRWPSGCGGRCSPSAAPPFRPADVVSGEPRTWSDGVFEDSTTGDGGVCLLYSCRDVWPLAPGQPCHGARSLFQSGRGCWTSHHAVGTKRGFHIGVPHTGYNHRTHTGADRRGGWPTPTATVCQSPGRVTADGAAALVRGLLEQRTTRGARPACQAHLGTSTAQVGAQKRKPSTWSALLQ